MDARELSASLAPPLAASASSPLFASLAETSSLLAGTRSRLEKQRLLVSLLGTIPTAETASAVGWLVGEPLCGPLGVGPTQLWELSAAPAAEAASLTLQEVERRLAEAKRSAEHADKLGRVAALFASLTLAERALFTGALTGSLRQGSLGGVMLLAVAERTRHTEAEVRQVVMLKGGLPAAAETLVHLPPDAALPSSIALFHPVAPMLASPAESIEQAMAGETKEGAWQVEWKVDGVRAQIHKQGERVAVYSRQGNDITQGCAPLLPALASLGASALVLDGEVVLVGADGIARPFQDTFSAIASKGAVPPGDRLRVYLFDCLHRDGADLLDAPLAERWSALHAVAPEDLVVPALQVASVEDAKRFYVDAVAAGNEGVVVKDLASTYRFGARGRAWQKVKEVTTVDLVVLAAEWGSGRRKGFLSNLHLGARREDGSFCLIGKTFKGLTDELLRWQTARLQELATKGGQAGHEVRVRPELVVEIRFNDVQRSPRYPGRIALRFARVVRYREDKSASEIEPLAALVARLPRGLSDDGRKTAEKPRGPGKRAKDASVAKTPAKKRQLSLFDD